MDSIDIADVVQTVIERMDIMQEFYVKEVDKLGNVTRIALTREEFERRHQDAIKSATRKRRRRNTGSPVGMSVRHEVQGEVHLL